jgi:hypothetical protein
LERRYASEVSFSGWGRGPVGWSHGQSFFFQFVALGQVKRPSRRRTFFREARSGKGQFQRRIQGWIWIGIRFGWSRFGPAVESIELREFWPSDLRREAVTGWQQQFGLQFAPILGWFVFGWFVFGSNGFRPAFGSIISIRCSVAIGHGLGLKSTFEFIRPNRFRPPESVFR